MTEQAEEYRSTKERYVLQAGDVMRMEKQCIIRTATDQFQYTYKNIGDFNDVRADTIPIGSVEFVTEFCKHKDITLPDNISYPLELQRYLKRNITKKTFGEAKDTEFVKPLETKQFTGAIKKDIDRQIDDSRSVWVSNPIDIRQEYRYYILHGSILGYSRYDDDDDPDILPNEMIIYEMISNYTDAPIGYSIDVGIVGADTVLIEVNDAWSLGYYHWGTMTQSSYVEMVKCRWDQILKLSFFGVKND